MANFNRISIINQIKEEDARLEEQGYDTSFWDIEAAADNAIQQFEETGSDEAEIRYDGIKYFIVGAEDQ